MAVEIEIFNLCIKIMIHSYYSDVIIHTINFCMHTNNDSYIFRCHYLIYSLINLRMKIKIHNIK